MRVLCIFIFIISISPSLLSQQQVISTQYFNQTLNYNPAYAGNHKMAEINAGIRAQWLGLEGAPTTQFLNANTAILNRRVGLGAAIQRTSIAITTETNVDLQYAYRIKLKKGVLSTGISASFRNYNLNFSDERIRTVQNRDLDPSIPQGDVSKTVPDFGAGAYYKGNRFFIGLSVPRLLRNRVDFTQDAFASREEWHGYFTAGYSFEISRDLSVQPMTLVKYTKSSPIDFDFTIFFRMLDRYGFGINYRARNQISSLQGESLSFIFNTAISDRVLLGISYDMTLSQLRDYSGGSTEFFARYSFHWKTNSKKSPNTNDSNTQ